MFMWWNIVSKTMTFVWRIIWTCSIRIIWKFRLSISIDKFWNDERRLKIKSSIFFFSLMQIFSIDSMKNKKFSKSIWRNRCFFVIVMISNYMSSSFWSSCIKFFKKKRAWRSTNSNLMIFNIIFISRKIDIVRFVCYDIIEKNDFAWRQKMTIKTKSKIKRRSFRFFSRNVNWMFIDEIFAHHWTRIWTSMRKITTTNTNLTSIMKSKFKNCWRKFFTSIICLSMN